MIRSEEKEHDPPSGMLTILTETDSIDSNTVGLSSDHQNLSVFIFVALKAKVGIDTWADWCLKEKQ